MTQGGAGERGPPRLRSRVAALAALGLGLLLSSVGLSQAQQQQQQLERGQARQLQLEGQGPLVLPMRRKLRPDGETFLALFNDEQVAGLLPGNGRGLRGNRGGGGGAPNSTTVLLNGLAMGAIFGYFTVLKFEGNQEMELLVDTGSSDLLVASTLCKPCDEVTISRSGKNDPVRPLLDLEKANGLGVPCDHELCVGPCTEEHLARMGLATQSFCGPHGGTCIKAHGPEGEGMQGAGSGKTPCMFLNAFMDRSFDYGVLVRGPVGLGDLKVNMTYGAIVGGEDRIVKLPRGGGVLGMAPSACAIDTHLSCFPSLIDALAADRNVSRLVSICGNEEHPVMVVGGTDARLRAPGTEVTYTPMGPKPDSYDIRVTGASLGDVPLPVPEGALAHVDTGTSFCYVPQGVFDAFRKAMQTERYCTALPGVCPTAEDPTSIFTEGAGFPFTHSDVREKFPVLSFTSPNDVTLSMRGDDYMLAAKPIDAQSAYYVMVLNATDDNAFFFGQTLLQNLYTEFDTDNRRIGFAPAAADCRKAVGL